VATGGTFDHLHRGHESLLKKSFEVGREVVIGVTSDEFVAREGKKPDFNYTSRVRELENYLRRNFPGRKYFITKLYDNFGPGIAAEDVEAIVVSPETVNKVPIANQLRSAKGFKPLDVVVIDWVLANDGKLISSNRIRKGEVDREGRILGGRRRAR